MAGLLFSNRCTSELLILSNRIVIAPMCQHSAENGCMND